MMTGASIETTLELWASSLREMKRRIGPLFSQERSAVKRDCSSMACLAMNGARRDGCALRRLVILVPGGNRRFWGETDGTLMRCAIWCASMSLSILRTTMRCW